jgi:hypothetical protein
MVALLPSAKGTGMEILFKVLGKSLMCKRNNKELRIDPCCTQCVIFSHSE